MKQHWRAERVKACQVFEQLVFIRFEDAVGGA
jgi:hypothetical protein